MSTPEQPEPPQLTRRQLRELRNTASTPIITPEEAEAAASEPTPVVAPLPRAAEPLVVAEEPPAADEVDLDFPALTRRAARQQERLRTASVSVVEPEDIPAAGAVAAEDGEDAEASVPSVEAEGAAVDDEQVPVVEADDIPGVAVEDIPTVEAESIPVAEVDDAVDEVVVDAELAVVPAEDAAVDEPVVDAADEALVVVEEHAEEVEQSAADAAADGRPVVAPTFGSGLLAGAGDGLSLPASFDQLLSRGSNATGSLAASNALILSQTPETGAFASPVASTGEILVTGTFNLPESFGSTGTSHGSSDGKEIDAILVDGELPAASSPTPIAASSAISTIKSAEDIIKPPAPEKGSRLMLALVITAGALALALTGVLIVALVTGAFQ